MDNSTTSNDTTSAPTGQSPISAPASSEQVVSASPAEKSAVDLGSGDQSPNPAPLAIRLTDIWGQFPRVTSIPTWVPTRHYDEMAFDQTNNILYWYDFAAMAWNGVYVLPALVSGQFLTNNGSTLSWGYVPYTVVSFTCGEKITAGEVLRFQKGGGYQSNANTNYGMRAAANSTTYANKTWGVALTNGNYLGTGYAIVSGVAPGFTGLSDDGSKQYLDNFSSASSETITQALSDAEQNLNSVHVGQLWIPQSSRLDKLTIKARSTVGGSIVSVDVKRVNTIIATGSVNLGTGTLGEFTIDFTDVQTYKGEILSFDISGDQNTYIQYKASGDVYAPIYDPSGLGTGIDAFGGSIPGSGADIFMRIFEYTNFGNVNSTAGTRKIKMGHALTTTQVVLAIQELDANL